MLIFEIPGQFRIVYVHEDSAGMRGYYGNASRGVVPICLDAKNHEDASQIQTPVYVQYRSPDWRNDLPWKHVPMSLELFRAFLESPQAELDYLQRSGQRVGIFPGLLTALLTAPKEVLQQNLDNAIAAAQAPSPWKALHRHSADANKPLWACVYEPFKSEDSYSVCRLVYSGYAWYHESGELADAPEYFAEIDAADTTAPSVGDSAPTPPPVCVFPWRPWF